MYTVEHNNKIYAIHYPINEVSENNKTIWLSKEFESLQTSLMCYDKGKTFKTHKHKMNPRIISHTQECFAVVNGAIQLDIFEKEDNGVKQLGSLIASKGDVIIIWRGFHRLTVIEDNSQFYESKAGAFQGYLDDEKEYLDV